MGGNRQIRCMWPGKTPTPSLATGAVHVPPPCKTATVRSSPRQRNTGPRAKITQPRPGSGCARPKFNQPRPNFGCAQAEFIRAPPKFDRAQAKINQARISSVPIASKFRLRAAGFRLRATGIRLRASGNKSVVDESCLRADPTSLPATSRGLWEYRGVAVGSLKDGEPRPALRNAASLSGLRLANTPYGLASDQRGLRSIGKIGGEAPDWIVPNSSNPCRS